MTTGREAGGVAKGNRETRVCGYGDIRSLRSTPPVRCPIALDPARYPTAGMSNGVEPKEERSESPNEPIR
jgi:hypothetical protein